MTARDVDEEDDPNQYETSPNSPVTSRATSLASIPPRGSSPPPARATKRTRYESRLLRQLGLNDDLSVCRDGSQMVPVRPAKKKKRTFVGRWEDIPLEVQARICEHMSLYDTYVARLAGLSSLSGYKMDDNEQSNDDSDDDESEKKIEHPMRTRFIESVRAVEPLRNIWLQQHSKQRRMFLSPAQFCLLARLKIPRGFQMLTDRSQLEALNALQHLPRLRSILFSHISLLPDTLGPCESCLRELSLTKGTFHVVPTVVLKMRNLKRLILDHCRVLQHVPEGLGDALPKLQMLSVIQCERLKQLPVCLLDTIERNAAARKQKIRTALGGKSDSAAIIEAEQRAFGKGLVLLTPQMFDQTFFEQTFVQSRFPNIVKGMQIRHGPAAEGQQQQQQVQVVEQDQIAAAPHDEAQAEQEEDLEDVDIEHFE